MVNVYRSIHEKNFIENEVAKFGKDGYVAYQNYFIQVFGPELFEQIDGNQENRKNFKRELDELELIYSYEKNRWYSIDPSYSQLHYTDFYKFLHPFEYDDVNTADALFIFKLYDLNADGDWSFAEYVESIELNSGYLLINDFKHIVDTKKNKFKDSIDLDKNGLIDLKEFMAWNMPSFQQTINQTLDQIFKQCDIDGNKLLNESEIKLNYEFFSGFVFTNYGDDYQTGTAVHNEL
jgi:Ca2+-binding EF-hand superfamily protein